MRQVRDRGLTLIEMMVAVAILGIMAAIAWPSYQSSLARSRLTGAVEGLAQDMQLARSQSMKDNCVVAVGFTPGSPSAWSYTLTKASSPADCANPCAAGAAGCTTLRTVSGSEYKDVTLTSITGFSDNTVTFEPVRNTTNAAASAGVTLTGSNGTALKVELNAVGRVAICATSGSGGYPTCS